MCGRSSLTKTESDLEKRFDATFYSEDLERYNPLPNFNVAPTHVHPVITNRDPKHFRPLQWGLVPFWAKDPRIGSKLINARMESVLEKPAFKYAMEKRRCLVPFDGYYEWLKKGGKKIPYRITVKGQVIFSIAGIYEYWKSPSGEFIKSFSLITHEPSSSIRYIHDRMPAILLPENELAWIDMNISPKEALKLLAPYPDEGLEAYTISQRVNKVTENDPELIEPYDYT
jgi:putative SOS response-associated peptidase YedK